MNALHRALIEELGIKDGIEYEDRGVKIENTNQKASYPLKSIYSLYDFTVVLTKEQYKAEGYVEYEESTGITTYFEWVPNLEKT